MRILSKSKLLAFRQCPKRLWLEIHAPENRLDSSATEKSYAIGHEVGSIARDVYDPKHQGILIDPQAEGFDAAFERTAELLNGGVPIFEAGFRAHGALSFADVMLPGKKGAQRTWRMVEVKSSTSVKDYHRDDAAVQSFVARSAGVALTGIALAHIDSQWTYPGHGDYQGLLVEHDLTEQAFSRGQEVQTWIASAQATIKKRSEPKISTGKHCASPYECGFYAYCRDQEPQAEFPVTILPRIQARALKSLVEANPTLDLRDTPDDLLNDIQRRVKNVTITGKPFFDRAAAADALAAHKLPAYFMDFETIQFAVPIWKGTRPYQQIPFQFSVHRLTRTGRVEHKSFLDLSGSNPSEAFAESLIDACGAQGPVFVYNAGFENARIRELAQAFPRLEKALLAISQRVIDLLPIAQAYFYHPDQKGSWSIKAVLPAVCPDLRYEDLNGVQNGGMAMNAYLEAISPETTISRKSEIDLQLQAYCALDTYAMVRLWSIFSGK